MSRWREPHEIQNFPQAGGQRVQVRMIDGRCKFARAGKADWTNIKEWRFA